ncbi:MAG: hypothetical protein IPO18_09330 [bacterium]|nr:hypothetical protein [bacterium]
MPLCPPQPLGPPCAPGSLALLLLVPASALALDCTPDFNWTCTTNGFFNY